MVCIDIHSVANGNLWRHSNHFFNNDEYPSVSTTLDRFANLVRTPMASLPDKRRWGIRTKFSF